MFGKGLATGIVFACLFLFIMVVVKKLRNQSCMENYDERQMLARSKAYQAGFFTMLICLGIDVCIKLFGTTLYEEPLGEFAALFISLIVFGYKVIQEDAFVARTENKRNIYILYVAVIIAQITNTVSGMEEHQFLVDGKLTLRCLSPLCIVTFALILIFQYMHDRKVKMEDEEE